LKDFNKPNLRNICNHILKEVEYEKKNPTFVLSNDTCFQFVSNFLRNFTEHIKSVKENQNNISKMEVRIRPEYGYGYVIT